MSVRARTKAAAGLWLLVLALLASMLTATRAEAAARTVPTPSASMCDHSHSGLLPYNSLEDVRAGYYTGPPYQRYKVAVGSDVDWTLDPYQSLSWQMWLDTLDWTGPLIQSYDNTGNKADLQLAMAYAHDYVTDQPMDATTPDRPVLQQSSRRLLVLSCLYERDPQPWISEAMAGTVDFLSANYAGAYNHGLDQDNSIVVAGCVLGRNDWIDFARQRVGAMLPASIDDEGATNEQSAAYARYTYFRWRKLEQNIRTCGLPPLPGLAARLDKNAAFVAHATKPDGLLAPIGDTYLTDEGLAPAPGLPLSGVWLKNGWAFGRSSWARSDDPSFFSLRFGPGRQIHGGGDHGSVMLYAHGSPIITEPGSIGYSDPRRRWFVSAEAKNVLMLGANTCATSSYAKLLSSSRTPSGDRYAVQTPHCGGQLARRDVTYARATGALTVDDTTTALPSAQQRQQLWHLVPGTRVTVRPDGAYRTVVQLTMPNGSTAQLVTTSTRRGASARAAAAVVTARAGYDKARRALRAQRAVRRPHAPKRVLRARKAQVTRALAALTRAQRTAARLEDRGVLRVSVVTGRTSPFQGWVSGGVGSAVAAPVVIVTQSARAANIHTAITPARGGPVILVPPDRRTTGVQP